MLSMWCCTDAMKRVRFIGLLYTLNAPLDFETERVGGITS